MRRLRWGSSPKETRALEEYWDEVVRAAPAMPVPSADAPAELTGLIRQLHVAEGADTSRPAYEERLLRRLLAIHQESEAMSTTTIALPARSQPASWRPAHRPLAIPGRFAVAAALVILFIGLLILKPIADRDGGFGGGLVIQAPATPTLTPSDSVTLAQFDLGPDVLVRTSRAGDWLGTGLGIWDLGPSLTAQRRAGADDIWPGPMMFYVVEGEITVLADRDVEVQRASGVHETVVAEAEIVLTPGDSIMMLGESAATATGLTVTNTGTVNAHVMEWSMYVANPIGPSTPFPEGGEELREDYWYYHHVYTPNITRIDGPVILRLERVLVTAEDNVVALPGAYTLFLPVPGYEEAFKGDFKPDFLSPSEVKSSSLSIAEVYVLTVQPADSGTATSGA